MTVHPASIRIVWPPPGLESSQGILWKMARTIGLGGLFLTLPNLVEIAFPRPFNSLGLFGAAWWVRSLSALLGLLIVTGALGGLVSFFLRAREAAKLGIDLETILQVASDGTGDTAALIQGTRAYGSLSEERRVLAGKARVWSALLFLSAAIWIPAAWALALVLAGRGLLGPSGVLALTLAPAAVAFLAGLTAKGLEGTALQGAYDHRIWRRGRNSGQMEAARVWGEGIQEFRESRGEKTTRASGVSLVGAISAAGLAFLIFLPAAGFTAASSVGPALAAITIPRFSATEKRAGAMEAIRHLRLPADPGITPLEAGEALHAILSVGGRGPTSELLSTPARPYEQPLLPKEAENPMGIRYHEWPAKLFPAVEGGLGAEDERFLRRVGSHPALAEFDRLARAQGIDVLGARLALPLPPETSPFSIPIPGGVSLREAGYAMVAKAAVEFLDGDVAASEATILSLLSAGFLLTEDAPTLVEVLVGTVVADNAADALEGLYRASGRMGEADHLVRIREAVGRATEVTSGSSPRMRPGSWLAEMPSRVTAEGTLRGLRWEYFHLLASLAPCLNPSQVVFGSDQGYAEFLESARSSLVRYPGEEAVFQTMTRGWSDLLAMSGRGRTLKAGIRTVLGDGTATCAEFLTSGIVPGIF